MSRRHTVGGAQKVVTAHRSSTPSSALALNGAWLTISTVAPAFHGAKKVLQACFAQPGEEMLRCTSPGASPSQYIVDRAPTGQLRRLCRTSFGLAAAPEGDSSRSG